MNNVQTLQWLRSKFDSYIDVDSALEAAKVHALKYDPFNVSQSLYDESEASAALMDAVLDQQAELNEQHEAMLLDQLRHTSAAVRNGWPTPKMYGSRQSAPSDDSDPDDVEAAELLQTVTASLSANPFAAGELESLTNGDGPAELVTIEDMRPHFLWLEERFGMPLEKFLDAAYIPAVHSFCGKPHLDQYDFAFLSRRVKEAIEELQAEAQGGRRGR